MPMSPRLLRPIASSLDPDAAVYLNAVAAADGEQLEPAVKKAINDFVVGCKQDGIWSSIKASCLLAGPRTLSGALVPLKGASPTNSNFSADDYNRKGGIKGGGSESAKILDTNRANDADPQDSVHNAVWVHAADDTGTSSSYIDSGGTGTGSNNLGRSSTTANLFLRCRTSTVTNNLAFGDATGLIGINRSGSASYVLRASGTNTAITQASQTPSSGNLQVFGRDGSTFLTNARLGFYSIGESLGLGLLDARVSSYITAIGAALAPNYSDPDVNAYISAVELADGGLMLETGVRDAINDFVTGCKADGIWDAIKASCILAGARTLAGALVPLKGAAPTNNNFVSGDYNRETGLVGDGSTKYLDSNRANDADPQDSNHNAVYVTDTPTITGFLSGNATFGSVGNNRIVFATGGTGHQFDSRSVASSSVTVAGGAETGFIGHARGDSATISYRVAGTTGSDSQASSATNALNVFVFSRESGGVPTNARLAFYSVGESLDLEALDTRVSALITAIGAAI